MLDFSFCSCISPLIVCHCVLVVHWTSSRGLLWILCQMVHRSPFLWGNLLELYLWSSLQVSCFPDFSWSLYTCVHICSFEWVVSSSRLYRFTSVSQLSSSFWTGQLVTSVGKWSFLLGSLVEQNHCLSSKVGGGSAAGWAPCSSGASEWPPWSEEAPGCVPLCTSSWAQQSPMVRGVSVCVPWQSNVTGWVPWFGRVSAGLHHCSWLGGALGWVPCLGEAASCVQQLVRAVCWILLLDAAVGWTPWVDGTTAWAQRVTEQAPWLLKARGYTQQLDRAASFAPSLSWTEGWGYVQQLGGPSNLILCSGGAIEKAPWPVWPIGSGFKTARTASWTPLSDRTTSLAL